MIPAPVLQLIHFCIAHNIREAVCSPGSRSAPVLLSLVRHGGFSVDMVMDERSAGFKALGKAMANRSPVILLCTSGTAVLNYGPAIAEAYYQQVPLLVLTADRPPEWIDQQEGQAIRQNGVFQLHTRFSATLPSLDTGSMAPVYTRRLLHEALEALGSGPVHLNIPLREPLYPEGPVDFGLPDFPVPAVKTIRTKRKLEREELSPLLEIWNHSPSRLLVAGAQLYQPEVRNACKALQEYGHCPILGDALHNLHGVGEPVLVTDFAAPLPWTESRFQPSLLLTIGRGLVSKSLKNFLQHTRPRYHWHISTGSYPIDPYGTLTHWIDAEPEWFLTKLAEASYFSPQPFADAAASFFSVWKEESRSIQESLNAAVSGLAWTDFRASYELLSQLPENGILFLGNSMPVRYGTWLASRIPPGIKIHSNRGTSGIDGCVSTVVGLASQTTEPVFAILGDMSFFYDRNGLWAQAIPPNLKLLVLNNGGGNIFRILPASGKMPELAEYFELHQPLQARSAAAEAGMAYFSVDSLERMQEIIQEFMHSSGPALLECHTGKAENLHYLNLVKQRMSERHGNA